MDTTAKCVLYYNIIDQQLYNANGEYMGNSSFNVFFDNITSVELHYMTDTSSDSVENWTPWTGLEGNTVGSSICFDDDYLHAKLGQVYEQCIVGTSSLRVSVTLGQEDVNPTGVLLVYNSSGQSSSYPYSGYSYNEGVYTFQLESNVSESISAGTSVRVPQALLFKINSDEIDSSRASIGVFSFDINSMSHKLLNRLDYSNTTRLDGMFEHQIYSDGKNIATFSFPMSVTNLIDYHGQADIPKDGTWADKAYVDSKIITKTSELQNDAGFISQETDPVYTADKPNIALKSQLFSKQFSDLLGIPTTIGEYGITDAFIQNRTVTIGNGSIQIPQITQQSVKQLLGVDSELGSSVRFLNERGQFTQIQSVMTVNGVSADINGNVQLNLQALVNMQEIAGYVKAVKSVNGVLPNQQTLDVTITGDNINVAVFSQTEQTLNSFLYGVVTSVNEITPQEGSITLYASNIPYNDTDVAQRLDYILQNMGTGAIKTINGQSPDSDGNIQLSFVKSVDGIAPDSSGDIQLTVTIDGTSMSFYDAFQTLRHRIEQLEQSGGGTQVPQYSFESPLKQSSGVVSIDLSDYALKSDLFSKSFSDLTDTPTTLAGYGITDASISGRTITLGGNSIEVPESGSGEEYTLTKEAVDSVIGASTAGSTAKFYNEQGAFTTVTGFLPLSGGTIDGDLWLNGTLYTDQSLFVTFRNTLTLGCYATGGLPIEPDTVSELVLDKPNATARAKLVYTTESDTKREAGLYLDAKSSSSDPSEIYVPGFIRIWTGYDRTDPTNRIGLNGVFGITIQSKSGVNITSDTNRFKFNSKDVAVVDDITAHNTDITAHADLLALKVDAETYNTAITAINTALDGKENTGVAQGLVDAHATVTTSSDILGHIKVDNETITVDENGVATAHAVGHNIFDIFYSMSSKAPAGAMDLSLGTLIASCDTVFPDFWSECVVRKAEGSIRTLTEEEWQAEATANGSCGAFVVDEDAKSVRLPKITNMIQPGDVGVFKSAGLPNITGSLPDFYAKTGQNAGAGALSYQTSISNAPVAASSTGYKGLIFNASKSNSIYGNSTTVQPPTVGAKLYIQVFTSAVPASMAQAGEFINMLESYLPLSGGKMTGNIFWNTETGFGIRYADTNVDIGWSYGERNGSGIGFRGVNYNSNPGGFCLFARDAANVTALDGFADGRLQWDGKYVTALPGGYSGGTIYVGANRDIKTIADAIAYINRYSSGVNKKWTLKLDAGEYAIGMFVYGLWLAIEPASGSYSTACRLTGQITTDHFAVLEFTNMHFGGTTNGTVNAGIYGKTSIIKCTNCTFYAGTSLTTSIQGDFGANFMLSGCKFYSPTTSFTNSWFQSIRLGGSGFAGMAGTTTTFTGGGYSNSYAMVVYGGAYIHTGGGAVTISNYKYGVNASQSGNAYIGSTITFNNVTTQFSPAKGTVGNGNSYIN